MCKHERFQWQDQPFGGREVVAVLMEHEWFMARGYESHEAALSNGLYRGLMELARLMTPYRMRPEIREAREFISGHLVFILAQMRCALEELMQQAIQGLESSPLVVSGANPQEAWRQKGYVLTMEREHSGFLLKVLKLDFVVSGDKGNVLH